MQHAVMIENIEEMRLREGIDDIELRNAIRGLMVGDFVKLTFLARGGSFETLPVRITRIAGASLRGKLVSKPTSSALSQVRAGSRIAFTTTHIHSIPREQVT